MMSLSPPFLLPDFVSLKCAAIRMKLRKECEEAMHSIAMVTIRLQSCLSLEHRIRVLWVSMCVCSFACFCLIKCLRRLSDTRGPLLCLYPFRGHYPSGDQSPAENSQTLKAVSDPLLTFEDKVPPLLFRILVESGWKGLIRVSHKLNFVE